jgi:hypothetical protein
LVKSHPQDIKKLLLFPSYARRHLRASGRTKVVLNRFKPSIFAAMMKKKSVGLNIRLRECLANVNEDLSSLYEFQSSDKRKKRKREPSPWSFANVKRPSRSSSKGESFRVMERAESHHVRVHRSLSLLVTWDGKAGKSFDSFRAAFEGNLLQQGMGYACHSDFLKYYQENGNDGILSFLSDDSVSESVKCSVPKSKAQLQYDKEYIFGALRCACHGIQRQVPILEHLNDNDGFLAWYKIRQRTEDSKDFASLKLRDRLETSCVESNDPDELLEYVDNVDCCYAELKFLGEDDSDILKRHRLMFGLSRQLFETFSDYCFNELSTYEECRDFLRKQALKRQYYRDRETRRQLLVMKRIMKVNKAEERRNRQQLLNRVRDLLKRTSPHLKNDDLKRLYRELYEV